MLYRILQNNNQYIKLFQKRLYTGTLNPDYYKSSHIFNLERYKIFNKNWLPIGYTNEFNNSKILCKKFGNTEIIITKTKNDIIKSFYNTCRHRGSRLINKNCNVNNIICPYHLWKYSLDGELLSTPRFEEPNFNKESNGLYEIKTSIFRNIICINFDNNCDDIYKHFGDISDDLKNYPLEECKIVKYKTYEANANWKLLQENFLEYYHLPSVHPELVKSSGMNEHEYTSINKKGKYIGFKTDPITDCDAPIEPKYMKTFSTINENEKKIAHFHTIYPNIFHFLLPNHLFSIILEPINKFKTIEHATLFVHNEQDENDEQIDLIWDYWDKVNKEDINICEEVQKGMNCREFRSGYYVLQYERNIKCFHDMIEKGLECK